MIILRHAESPWNSAANDFSRPLTPKGLNDAATMGSWLLHSSIYPEIILSSSALRARETATAVNAKLGLDTKQLVFTEKLYLANTSTLLAQIGSVNKNIHCTMLVAHNPGLEQLVYHVTRSKVTLQPASTAIVTLKCSWNEIQEAKGKLLTLKHASD